MSKAYYNEFDRHAAAWLRELIKDGLIADGDVDERSITEVQPSDLNGYTQCHFFAGIGGWSYALRLAGWPDDQPVWTGSCPCQPFSVAGKGKGTADERHLWPELARLIGQCHPPVVFGEQVASKAGRDWLALVFADLEGMAYRLAGADLCAAGVGAPHIRQRLWWVADRVSPGLSGHRRFGIEPVSQRRSGEEGHLAANGVASRLGHASSSRHASERCGEQIQSETRSSVLGVGREVCGMGHAKCCGSQRQQESGCSVLQSEMVKASEPQCAVSSHGTGLDRPPTTHSGWSNVDWLYCQDAKWRPVEPGLEPLVDGLPRGVVPSGDPSQTSYANATSEARQMRLKGYGNAIVPQLAATFIEAYVEALND